MKFRTEIDVPQSSWKITPEMKGISIGSCFTNYIGGYLQASKFNIKVNPFGTVYNPVSIANCFDLLHEKIVIDQNDLFYNAGLWSSHYLHSSFSSPEKSKLLSSYANVVQNYKSSQKSLDYAILTLGTSWVYELISSNQIVSNCHKIPAKEFNRIKLSVAEIEEVLVSIIDSLLEINPNCKIITTISPIRHWKDGAHDNQISKSQLFVAVDSIMQEFSMVEYFPAYELLIDDLRDYRFYEDDLLHPNSMAVDYIREKFIDSYIDNRGHTLIKQVQYIKNAQNHRVINNGSEEHLKFKKTFLQKTKDLQKEYEMLDFTEEINAFLCD